MLKCHLFEVHMPIRKERTKYIILLKFCPHIEKNIQIWVEFKKQKFQVLKELHAYSNQQSHRKRHSVLQ